VPRAELACGRVGVDGDGITAQPVRPALRLLSGWASCMAASCCSCMAREIIPPHASVVVPEPWAFVARPGPCASRSRTCCARQRLVVRGVDLSCKAETSRARRRLIVGFPLVGNWSEMQPTGRRLDVFPVWILTRVLTSPCPESLL
jgi:hypothetical protein